MDSQPTPISSISSPFSSAPPKPFPQSMQLSFDSHSSSPHAPSPHAPGSHGPSPQTPAGGHEPGPYFNPHHQQFNNSENNNNNSGGNGSNSLTMSEGMKKKRGRPRKYGPDGAVGLKPGSGSNLTGTVSGGNSSSFKKMGRPPGSSKKKQLEALGASGVAFTPHIITVPPGEDVASKIMAFSQQGPRTICILSANGAISNVSLRQAATSGGLVTYEGRFEIISLSGSFLLAQDGDTKSRTGGLSVALSGSDGRVLGGCVAGMLLAATPVQVVVGSFIAEGKKPKTSPPEPILSHSHSHSHTHSHSQPISSPLLSTPNQIRPGPPPHFAPTMNNNSGFNPGAPAGNSPPSDVMSDEYSTSDNDDGGNEEGDDEMHHHVAQRFGDQTGRVTHFNHMGWPISSNDGSQNRRE